MPATGFSVLVAAAAAAPTLELMLVSALARLLARLTGSVALKNAPRPLTAACHRSSMFSTAPTLGVGQLQTVLAACQVQTLELAVLPSLTAGKSPVVSVR